MPSANSLSAINVALSRIFFASIEISTAAWKNFLQKLCVRLELSWALPVNDPRVLRQYSFFSVHTYWFIRILGIPRSTFPSSFLLTRLRREKETSPESFVPLFARIQERLSERGESCFSWARSFHFSRGWCLGTHTLFSRSLLVRTTPEEKWGEIAKLHKKKSKRSLSRIFFPRQVGEPLFYLASLPRRPWPGLACTIVCPSSLS